MSVVRQQQSLVLFEDNTVIPDSLRQRRGVLSTITHDPATSPSWLYALLMKDVLGYGAQRKRNNNMQLPNSSAYPVDPDTTIEKSVVVIISFKHDRKHFESLLGRYSMGSQNNQVHIIDAFTNFYVDLVTDKKDILPRPQTLSDLLKSIQRYIDQYISPPTNGAPSMMFIIDGLETVIASQKFTYTSIYQFITRLRSLAFMTFVSITASEVLVDLANQSEETTIEYTHRTVVSHFVANSAIVLSLRKLRTGYAKDVTGILRVSPGGETIMDATADKHLKVKGDEFQYYVPTDKPAQLFYP